MMSESIAIAIPEEEIRAYCKGQPIQKLSLFGSALRDELRLGSDIDLLVEYLPGAKIGYFELAQQEIDLSVLIGWKVDLHTPNELNRFFRQDVLDSARLIYARGSR
jgi:predicted nucleotidyltransferase